MKTMAINDQTVFRMTGRVVLRRIGRDQLLVPVTGDAARNNRVFPVNRTAAFIWGRLCDGRSIAEAARDVTDAFTVEYATALEDCRTCAASFVDQQLMEVVPS